MKQAESTTLSSGCESAGYTSIMMLDNATQLRMAHVEQPEVVAVAAPAEDPEKSSTMKSKAGVKGVTKEMVAVVVVMTVFTTVFWMLISLLRG